MNKSAEAVNVTDEQYAVLIEELVPTIIEFYNSEDGQRLFDEYIKEQGLSTSKDAA